MANVLPPITDLKRVALDLIFPQWCIGCGREGDYICGACRQLLPVITPPICPRCGRPQPQGTICSGCSDIPAEIDGIRSPFIFNGVIRKAIHELKYRNLRALVPSLAGLLRDYLVENPVPGGVLVPVPLHQKRWRERGYNQSALLARELSRLSGLPLIADCLVRHSYALPQARSAGVNERHKNVANAFTCLDGRLQGKQVLLIDDVSTSGATLNACARALKAGGAVTVWGLVMALEL
jgi:competence protein ComFC